MIDTSKKVATALALTLALSSLTTPAFAEDNWYPPQKYGADDTLGAMNELSEKKTKLAAQLVKTGKTYALGVETGPTSPRLPTTQLLYDYSAIRRWHGGRL